MTIVFACYFKYLYLQHSYAIGKFKTAEGIVSDFKPFQGTGAEFSLDGRSFKYMDNSGYRIRNGAHLKVTYAEEAEKNASSHPHDALQYLLSGGGEDVEIRERAGEARRTMERQPMAVDAGYSFNT